MITKLHIFLCRFQSYTVIRFLWVSAKFITCTVVRINGTLVEDKMLRFKGECEHFRFNKCPIYCILTTVQVPNLALTHKKWITVYMKCILFFSYCRTVGVSSAQFEITNSKNGSLEHLQPYNTPLSVLKFFGFRHLAMV